MGEEYRQFPSRTAILLQSYPLANPLIQSHQSMEHILLSFTYHLHSSENDGCSNPQPPGHHHNPFSSMMALGKIAEFEFSISEDEDYYNDTKAYRSGVYRNSTNLQTDLGRIFFTRLDCIIDPISHYGVAYG